MKGLRQALQSAASQCVRERCSQRTCYTQELYSVLWPTMLQKADLFTQKSRVSTVMLVDDSGARCKVV